MTGKDSTGPRPDTGLSSGGRAGARAGRKGVIFTFPITIRLDAKACYNNAEDVNNYGSIYQYDPLGSIIPIGGGTTTYWGANTFTALNDQALEAVGFYTTDSNVSCNIYIYKNTGPNGPTDGLLAATRLSASAYAGYYAVKLNAPVPLSTGERFSVVIQFNNSIYRFPVAIEKPIEDYSSKAAANPGESWISKNGQDWKDLCFFHANSNVCIKAFTTAPPVSRSIVTCQASWEVGKVWIISKYYGNVTFRIENLREVPVSRVVIYRKNNDENYQAHYEISADAFQGGSYTYIDKYLDPTIQYTYHVTAYDSSGTITGRSEEQTVFYRSFEGE